MIENWQFLKGDVGNVWELVRPVRKGQPECQPIWTPVTLPHCFNAEDGVDPDVNYYQGPGWYKTQLDVNNPYVGGRVFLEFEGAGQKTEVYVYMEKVASHVGGYDSWNVDITEAINRFLGTKDAERFKGKVPLSIRCDNSRDAEMIPSDLSDFNLYGGLYRYVNLVYTPAVSVSSLQITPEVPASKRGVLSIAGHFYNPTDVKTASVSIEIENPQGEVVASRQMDSVVPLGDFHVEDIEIQKPIWWHVDAPKLYTCRVFVTADGQTWESTERFGFRTYEFQEKGPFFLNGERLLLRGTHRHEDHAGVGAAMTEEQMVEEMK